MQRVEQWSQKRYIQVLTPGNVNLILFGKRASADEIKLRISGRNHPGFKLSHKSMTSVLVRKRKGIFETDLQGRRPCEDRGRDGRDGFTSQKSRRESWDRFAFVSSILSLLIRTSLIGFWVCLNPLGPHLNLLTPAMTLFPSKATFTETGIWNFHIYFGGTQFNPQQVSYNHFNKCRKSI